MLECHSELCHAPAGPSKLGRTQTHLWIKHSTTSEAIQARSAAMVSQLMSPLHSWAHLAQGLTSLGLQQAADVMNGLQGFSGLVPILVSLSFIIFSIICTEISLQVHTCLITGLHTWSCDPFTCAVLAWVALQSIAAWWSMYGSTLYTFPMCACILQASLECIRSCIIVIMALDVLDKPGKCEQLNTNGEQIDNLRMHGNHWRMPEDRCMWWPRLQCCKVFQYGGSPAFARS